MKSYKNIEAKLGWTETPDTEGIFLQPEEASTLDSALAEADTARLAAETALATATENHEAAIAEATVNHEAAIAGVNEQLTTAQADLATAGENLATVNASLEAANQQLATTNEQLATANARIAELEELTGVAQTAPVVDVDESASKKKTYKTSFDDYLG